MRNNSDLIHQLTARPDEETLVQLLEIDDFSDIYRYADAVTEAHHGKIVHLRAIIEFSNFCKRQCLYCGLNVRNQELKRYRMTAAEIVETAVRAKTVGYRTVVLQSGEDPYFTTEYLGDIVKTIRTKTDLVITLSCGEKSFSEFQYLKDCGAERYLLKHETADASLYERLHPCGSFENRVKCLKDLKKLGYETGSGFMIGLPGQTSHTIAKDILLLYRLQCEMAGIGPFIPHPNTALGHLPAGSVETTKRAVALTRILLPKANLPATTALETLDAQTKQTLFSCGANVIMRKVTPPEYLQYYEIYPTSRSVQTIDSERTNLEMHIRALKKIPR